MNQSGTNPANTRKKESPEQWLDWVIVIALMIALPQNPPHLSVLSRVPQSHVYPLERPPAH